MKLYIVMSVILASILSCIVAIAAPPMPNDVQMVQPNPSLPKELADFWGKWEGNLEVSGRVEEFCLIVEKIDEEKASLYIYRRDVGWVRYDAKVSKDKGRYKLSYLGRAGWNELIRKGEYLDLQLHPRGTARLRPIP